MRAGGAQRERADEQPDAETAMVDADNTLPEQDITRPEEES